MSCLNCNKDTVGKAVFCESCLAEMEEHPIPKGTPIVIPVQPSPPSSKKQSDLLFGSLEEQVQALRKRNRRLKASLIVVLLLFLIAAGGLGYCLYFGIPDYITELPMGW